MYRHCTDTYHQRVDACLPITALEALQIENEKFILQGQGLYCRLIDTASGQLLAELKTFKRNNIHGFSIFHQESGRVRFLAWGGQSVRVIDLVHDRNAASRPSGTSLSATTAEFLAPDWILAGCASRSDNGKECAYLVTAHNALIGLHVVEAEPSSKYEQAIHLQQLATGVKSILYSAHTVQISSSHVLIAAGTVFGEIIVWSCFISNPENLLSSAISSIHHFFTGHDGSIFGVEISPVIQNMVGSQSGRLLASCSDDRTIRIWDISDCDQASPQGPSAYSTDGFELRSTGFGAVRELGSESCVAKAFGHTARIWGIHFMTKADENKVRLVSRGEDAQCLLWDLTLGPSSSQVSEMQLHEVSSFHCHAGKHIFSLCMHSIAGGFVFYTAGNDGAIKVFTIDERAKQSGEIFHEIGTAMALPNSRDNKGKKGNTPLKAFEFVSPDCYIGTSVSGEVQLGWIGSKNLAEHGMQPHITKETVSFEDSLRGYSVISSLPQRGLALIGDSRGLIRLYNHQNKTLTNVVQTDQRPLGLFALDSTSEAPLEAFSFVSSYTTTDRANLFTVSLEESRGLHVQNISLCLLYPSEIQCASFFRDGHYLALGFKNGALAVYRLPGLENVSGEPLEPLISIRAVHGEDGTNQITHFLSQPRDDGTSIDYLLTCGRDGNYCVHEVFSGSSDSSFHLQTIHRSSPAVNQNIEGAYFDKDSDDLILYGFRGMDFVLWNESTKSEITKFFCGGARRIWAFYPSQEVAGDGVFLWHQSGFNCRRIRASASRPVRAGGHGREVKSMEVFNSSDNEGKTVFATGAEDTTVRIFEPIRPGTESLWGALKCLRVLKKHRTGLQQVGWSKDGRFLFTSAGYEEFFVWRIRWVPRFGLATLLVGVAPKEDPDSECRVTSFDTLEVEEQGGQYGFLVVLTFPNSVIKVSSFPVHYFSRYAKAGVYIDLPLFPICQKWQFRSSCERNLHEQLPNTSSLYPKTNIHEFSHCFDRWLFHFLELNLNH